MGNITGRKSKNNSNSSSGGGFFGSRKEKAVKLDPNKAFIVGNDIRCPKNHLCCTYVEERQNNVFQILDRKELTCRSCKQSLAETEDSFSSCVICNFDICSKCIDTQKAENLLEYQGESSISFKDSKGVQIRLCLENNVVFQYRTIKKPSKNKLKKESDTEKREVTTFHLRPNGNYRDYQGTGRVVDCDDLTALKTQIDHMLNYARERREKYKDFENPTFVHNPKYEFMQPSTLTQTIMKDKDFECPKYVAEIISSFVVERKISIKLFYMEEGGSGYMQGPMERKLPAHQTIEDLEHIIKTSYGGYEYDVRKITMIKEQPNIANFTGGEDILDSEDMDDLYMVGYGGDMDRLDPETQKFELPPGDALIGDVFGTNSPCVIIDRVYNAPRWEGGGALK